MNQQVILASSSKNRQILLKALGIPFKVVISHFKESSVKAKNPAIRASKIALGKALAVSRKHHGIIIAADTFTICQYEILEKPKNLDQAKKMLKKLSGRQVISFTGLCIINTQTNSQFTKTIPTKVTFRRLSNSEIDQYVKRFPVTSWAAAYAASELYVAGMIEEVRGSLTGLTHGLPAEFIVPLLDQLGYPAKPV